MTKPDPAPSGRPEFSRIVEVARLKGTAGQDFDVSPDESETAALATMFAARKLSKVRFTGTIRPFGKSEWELNGHLGATIVQDCVVTLAPVRTRIDTAVHRLFVHEIAVAAEVELDPEADVDVELLGPTIDPGLIATEELALAVPEYPRAVGAELAPAYGTDDEGPAGGTRPFDALKVLRDRLPE